VHIFIVLYLLFGVIVNLWFTAIADEYDIMYYMDSRLERFLFLMFVLFWPIGSVLCLFCIYEENK